MSHPGIRFHDVQRARRIAGHWHAGQRYGSEPYVVHLDRVAAVLARHGFAERAELLVIAYLHDLLEDTAYPAAMLERMFCARVAAAVQALTDPPGGSRAARKQAAYPRIAANQDALLVKLADRIANVEVALQQGPAAKRALYAGEQAGFAAALEPGSPPAAAALWQTLAQLLAEVATDASPEQTHPPGEQLHS